VSYKPVSLLHGVYSPIVTLFALYDSDFSPLLYLYDYRPDYFVSRLTNLFGIVAMKSFQNGRLHASELPGTALISLRWAQ
jgi:hypothetical protein